MPQHLHVILPDLLWPEPEELAHIGRAANPAPALATLLQHAAPSRGAQLAAEEQLAALAGYPGAPLAPLRLLGEGGDVQAKDWWLCADPIHLRLMREQMLAAASHTLQLTAAEAEALVALLNKTFADIGQFHAASPERWYLRLPQPCAFPAPPLSRIAGRRLHDELPQGGEATPLLQFLIEAQMLLHTAPTNRQRSGKLPANSLWLWGAGALEQITGEPSFDHAWGDDALLRGLARHAQRPCQSAPTKAADWLANAATGRHLLWLDHCALPTQADDGPGWQAALEQLETDWFAPLLAALDAGQLASLQISTSGGYGPLTWQLTPASGWQRLQRGVTSLFGKKQAPSLADLARQLRP